MTINGRLTRHAVRDRLRRVAPARRQRWDAAIAVLEAEGGGRELLLVDAGCDYGLLTLELARRQPAWRVLALDLSHVALQGAVAEQARTRTSGVLFAQADVTRPLPGRPCDALLALECLTEIPDDEAAVERFAQALRPGGLLVAHVPTDDWRPLLLGSADTWRSEVRHGYSAAQIQQLLERHSFVDVRVRPTMRGTVTVAQEVRDRMKDKPGWTRAVLYPLLVAAPAVEGTGLSWGPPRGLFVTGRRG